MVKQKFSEFQIIHKFFEALKLPPNQCVMVDVGAQIGLWTVPYAKLGWQVVAFEASPTNFQMLLDKTQSFPNVTALNKAIGDENAESVKFYYSEEYIGINSVKTNHAQLSQDKFALVEMVTLGTELAINKVKNVNLLKIDIEGADLLALKGFDFTRYHPDLIVCEYGGRSKSFDYTYQDLVAFGQAEGYDIYASSWESGKNWKIGDKPMEHKLISFGRYSSSKHLNWGDIIFVSPEKSGIFDSLFDCFNRPVAK